MTHPRDQVGRFAEIKSMNEHGRELATQRYGRREALAKRKHDGESAERARRESASSSRKGMK